MIEELAQFSVRGKLAPKIISKNILPYIVCDEAPPKILVETLNIKNEVKRLTRIYKEYQEPSDMNKGSPRYLPFIAISRKTFQNLIGR